MSLRASYPSVSRDFYLLFSVIAVMIVLVSVYVAYGTFESYSDSVVQDIENEAVRIDRSIIIEVQSASFILESLARQITQIGTDDLTKIAALLRSFDNESDIRSDTISWLNRDLDVVVTSTGGVLDKPVNNSDRDYVKKALSAPWQVHLGRPINGRVSGHWVVPLSLGVTDLQGKFSGVLILSLDVDKLNTLLSDMVRDSGIDFSIYTNTLTHITDSIASTKTPLEKVTQKSRLAQIDFEARPRGVLSQPELFTASTPFSYYEVSSKFPYIIYLTYDQSFSDKQISTILIRRLGQIFVIAGFLLLLLYMVRTQVIKPIEQLSNITANVAAGKGFNSLPKDGPIEIEQLALQIKKLSDYIDEEKMRHQQLQHKGDQLMHATDKAQHVYDVRSGFLRDIASIYHAQTQQLERVIRRDIVSQLPQSYRDNEVALEQYEYQLAYIKRITDDILTASAKKYGAMALHDVEINIAFAVHRAIRIFREKTDYHQIEINPNIHENAPMIRMDETLFIDMMVHLFGAVFCMAAQGTVVAVNVHTDKGEKGEPLIALHLSYQSKLTSSPISVITSRIDKNEPQQQMMMTDKVAIAIARMQAALYYGTLTTSGTKGEAQRIVVKFPVLESASQEPTELDTHANNDSA